MSISTSSTGSAAAADELPGNMPPYGPPDTTEGLPATTADAADDAPPPGRYPLGPIEQIPYGEGRTFDVAGEQVAVFRLRNGQVHALSAVCTHRGGPIADGQLDDKIVLCPLHMNAFELATGCSTTGAAPLRRYDVSVTNDEITVMLSGPTSALSSLQEPT